MERLLNILLVHRAEVENKWWHRLITVVIYGSTILVAISAITLFVLKSEMWRKYSYTAFSFESNYSVAMGREVKCVTSEQLLKQNGQAYYSNNFSATCEGIPMDAADLVARYDKIVKDAVGTDVIQKICADAKQEKPVNTMIQELRDMRDKYKVAPEKKTMSAEEFFGATPTKTIQCMNLTYGLPYLNPISSTDISKEYLTDEQVAFLKAHDFDLKWNLKAKSNTVIIYPVLFLNLLYVLMAIVSWFIFWESIIYRTLLYIIYGKKK